MAGCVTVPVSLGWLLLFLAGKVLVNGNGLHASGHYSISGLFPLHNSNSQRTGLPALEACQKGQANKHGYHLMEAMRFAVEEINNHTQNKPLLPGVMLGYQAYDLCSLPASVLATLDLLKQQYHPGPDANAVAVIGPDSSGYAFAPAALLGAYLVPQISYEASNELLSNKRLYPAFFRTIPSDKNQVAAMIQLLVRFGWTWIALLGSDNSYGLQGMQSLSQQAITYNICVAYQGVIPSPSASSAQTMRNMVTSILGTKVTTIVVFSTKRIVTGFFPFVIERNVTGKVWIGTEDWSVATLVSGIPGIQTIGSVLGVSIQSSAIPGFKEFEKSAVKEQISNDTMDQSLECLQNIDMFSLSKANFSLELYDVLSSFNVYKAVYAVAHALHKTLECDSGECRKELVHPWQLLSWLKKVRFNVGSTSVYFDENGDPATGYDIVTWVWRGSRWSLRVVGSFTSDPTLLTVDPALVEWNSSGGSESVPLSICSPECPPGFMKLFPGQHKCCFDCLACPTDTFLNRSGSTWCQQCELQDWAPKLSEQCLERSVLFLSWDAPWSLVLLLLLTMTLAMTFTCALVFLLHLDTPVARSAGGRTCLLMLGSLTVATASAFSHFGHPSQAACTLKQPLFILSFSVCLVCMTVRSFQVVCIFKFSAKLPRAYDTWAKSSGPEFTILAVFLGVLFISVLRLVLSPPLPSRDVGFYPDSLVEECSDTLSLGAMVELAYISLLSILCFSLSYMGKDLPANYNEAKCVTFSLLVYMISWISFFTIYFISRGHVTMAMHVLAIISSVLGVLGGYFLPKVYIIVLKPQMNTASHFQNCIQMYTMNKQ
ncbi:taste receptor type 1 member 1 [Aplochiton taeniatus]